MQSLILIFVAHALLRFPGDGLAPAAVVSCFLALCMLVVARFGGWTSMAGSFAWLRSHRGFALLLAAGALILLVVSGLAWGEIPLNHLLAYQIEAFFFGYACLSALHAFWATGIESIASWFRR